MAVHVERAGEQTAFVRFSLPESEDPSTVSVVGSFNDWTPGAHPFNDDKDGQWSVTIEVPYGEEIHFRYLGDGGRWFDDQDAEVSGEDGGRIRASIDESGTFPEGGDAAAAPEEGTVLDLNGGEAAPVGNSSGPSVQGSR